MVLVKRARRGQRHKEEHHESEAGEVHGEFSFPEKSGGGCCGSWGCPSPGFSEIRES